MAKLQQAAQSGPVVVINVNNSRCDALIVMKDLDEVIHVPLNNFSRERALNLHESLYQLLSKAGVRVRDTRHMQRASTTSDDCEFGEILSSLWTYVVKPVLDVLAFPVSCLFVPCV